MQILHALVLPALGCCIPLLYLCPSWSWHCATCTGGVLPSINWHNYSTCTHGGHHRLQIALVVFVYLQYNPLTLLVCIGTPSSYPILSPPQLHQSNRYMAAAGKTSGTMYIYNLYLLLKWKQHEAEAAQPALAHWSLTERKKKEKGKNRGEGVWWNALVIVRWYGIN